MGELGDIVYCDGCRAPAYMSLLKLCDAEDHQDGKSSFTIHGPERKETDKAD